MSDIEVQIDGLTSLQEAMGRAREGLGPKIQAMLTSASETVAADARQLVPRGSSGLARASLKTSLVSGRPTVTGGSQRVRYFGFLEFGGTVGPKRSVKRAFVPGGRTIWPSWMRNRQSLLDAMERGLEELTKDSGL